ncbi:hypothetical protein IP78_11465 [Brevundimonas sp. AAP58]|uniref:hypothetical protein n=1 Tax=Brevundimonas sp. AAP58 TaxID=1523422 RepID=UPI0006CD4434|nr:hypothetical protein [Brevundimonas sp. AAP58]KPF78039.1 hypothetical protein IP78_11465 [Brevundimonas sp. AAP58]
MAEPGDPKATDVPRPDHDLDDAVGFASPASLAGRPRQAAPEPEPEPASIADPEPVSATPVPEPDLFTPPAAEPELLSPPEPEPESVVPARPIQAVPPADPTPAWARETPAPQTYAGFGARREIPAELQGASGLYTVYALILFAVPTLGVSALIALLAVTGRPGPSGDVAASHFVFQQRTLWAGAVVALAGAILIVVGLGVFVLFLLALWLIVRGAAGVLKLKAGRAMPNPRGWLI